jgi:hypothetical protein
MPLTHAWTSLGLIDDSGLSRPGGSQHSIDRADCRSAAGACSRTGEATITKTLAKERGDGIQRLSAAMPTRRYQHLVQLLREWKTARPFTDAAARKGRRTPRAGPPHRARQLQRRQPESDRPALGPIEEATVRGRGELHTGLLQQHVGLRFRERQIRGSDLDELAIDAQPMQTQPGVGPGDQHQSKR